MCYIKDVKDFLSSNYYRPWRVAFSRLGNSYIFFSYLLDLFAIIQPMVFYIYEVSRNSISSFPTLYLVFFCGIDYPFYSLLNPILLIDIIKI